LIQSVSSSLAAQEEKREKNPPTPPEIAKMWTIFFLVQQYRHLHRVLMISLEHLLFTLIFLFLIVYVVITRQQLWLAYQSTQGLVETLILNVC